MKVAISIGEKKLDKVMTNVEERLCKSWFYNNQHDYEYWAGDIVRDALWNFISELNQVADITIETYQN